MLFFFSRLSKGPFTFQSIAIQKITGLHPTFPGRLKFQDLQQAIGTFYKQLLFVLYQQLSGKMRLVIRRGPDLEEFYRY